MSQLDDILMWHEVNITNPQAKEKIKALFMEIIGENTLPKLRVSQEQYNGIMAYKSQLHKKVQDL